MRPNPRSARRVLMLCYYFPPISSAGTHRSVAFARWLQHFGWHPVVLTVHRSRTRWELSREEVPTDVEVVRSSEWDLQGVLALLSGMFNRACDLLRLRRRPSPFYAWCLPDPQIAWLSTLRGVVLARNAECVYASCSPFSSALSACVIKHVTGKPLVLDFRDPWALNPHANHSRGKTRILGWLEAWAVRSCDALILNTQGAEQLYRRRHAAHAHKMSCLPNGFDCLNLPAAAVPGGRFSIMHVGEFYRSRTPARLLEALASLDNDAIEFVQVGPWCEAFARYEGRVRIRHIDRVTHGEALSLMRTASVLYLAQGWEEGVSEYVSVASKTYEYLATGTPILADVPPGDNADVIQRYAHRAWVVTSRSVEALASVIAQAYESRGDLERRVTPAFERTFNRRHQAAILASVLDKVTSPCERDVPRERWNGVAPGQPSSVESHIQVDGCNGY